MAPTHRWEITQKRRLCSYLNAHRTRIPRDFRKSSVDLTARHLGSVIVRMYDAVNSAGRLSKYDSVSKSEQGQSGVGIFGRLSSILGLSQGQNDQSAPEGENTSTRVKSLILGVNNKLAEGKNVLDELASQSSTIAHYYTSFAGNHGYLEGSQTSEQAEDVAKDVAKCVEVKTATAAVEELLKCLPDLEQYLPELGKQSDEIQNEVGTLYSMIGNDVKMRLEKLGQGKMPLHIPQTGRIGQGWFKYGQSERAIGWKEPSLSTLASGDKVNDVLDFIRSLHALKHTIRDLWEELSGLHGHLKVIVPFSEKFMDVSKRPEVAAVIWQRMDIAIRVYKSEFASMSISSIVDSKMYEGQLEADPTQKDKEPKYGIFR